MNLHFWVPDGEIKIRGNIDGTDENSFVEGIYCICDLGRLVPRRLLKSAGRNCRRDGRHPNIPLPDVKDVQSSRAVTTRKHVYCYTRYCFWKTGNSNKFIRFHIYSDFLFNLKIGRIKKAKILIRIYILFNIISVNYLQK